MDDGGRRATGPARASAATSPTWRSRFCRALNIPARYVFGYIPEIDVPLPAEPMDFAAWFEVYLDGDWHTFDARNNRRRVGRVVVGRGRDAVDVALMTSVRPGDADRVRRPRRVAPAYYLPVVRWVAARAWPRRPWIEPLLWPWPLRAIAGVRRIRPRSA